MAPIAKGGDDDEDTSNGSKQMEHVVSILEGRNYGRVGNLARRDKRDTQNEKMERTG